MIPVLVFLSAPPHSVSAAGPILLAAGDIASCRSNGDEATAAVLDRNPGTVATLGDTVYPAATAGQFKRCYTPTWGRHKGRTRPAAGNHDYRASTAAAYYDYFGGAAGPRGKGYYSYELGPWHIAVLNSNCAAVGGCFAGSAQERWLRADLAAHAARCSLAYFHHPRWSSGGPHGNEPAVGPFWDALYDRGADVVLSGHDHLYERFAPQNPGGRSDPASGIRQFTVGTGGVGHYGFRRSVQPNSQVRNAGAFGVLKLTLADGAYDWDFLAAEGKPFRDTGHGTCHGRPEHRERGETTDPVPPDGGGHDPGHGTDPVEGTDPAPGTDPTEGTDPVEGSDRTLPAGQTIEFTVSPN